MNNLSSYYGLTDSRTSASEKDLPVPMQIWKLDYDIWNFPLLKNWEKIKTNKLSSSPISWLAGSPRRRSRKVKRQKSRPVQNFKFKTRKFQSREFPWFFNERKFATKEYSFEQFLKDDPKEPWIYNLQSSRQYKR